MALANLKVRKGKTLFLFLGIVLAIASVVALSTLGTNLQIALAQQLEKMGLRFLITPPVEAAGYTYHGIVLEEGVSTEEATLPLQALTTLETWDFPPLTGYSPKLVLAASGRGQDLLLCGLNFSWERDLKNWWEVQEGRFPQGSREILLGAKAAFQTGLKVNDEVILWGESFKVAGILREGGQGEDWLVFLNLATLQELSGEKSLSFIELRFQSSPQDLEEAISHYTGLLQEKFPQMEVTVVRDENLLRQDMVREFSHFAGIAAGVVFGLGWLVAALTMMASVNERVKEIGVLRAMGYRQRHIIQIIMWEAGIISGLGGVAGYLLGLGAGRLLLPLILGTSQALVWQPYQLPLVVLLSLVVGFSASLYPAYRAAQLDPIAAFSRL